MQQEELKKPNQIDKMILANYNNARCLPRLTSELSCLSENRNFLYKVLNFHFPYEMEYKFPYEEKDKMWKKNSE